MTEFVSARFSPTSHGSRMCWAVWCVPWASIDPSEAFRCAYSFQARGLRIGAAPREQWCAGRFQLMMGA